MAVIVDPHGNHHTLRSDNLFGRSGLANLRLAGEYVSNVHAELTWNGSAWQIKHHGTNPTWLDDRALEQEQKATLHEGVVLAFAVQSERWVLIDASPPRPVATCGDQIVEGDVGVLAFPDEQDPEFTLHELGAIRTRWLIGAPPDDGPDERPDAFDGQRFTAANGSVWTVTLPQINGATAVRLTATVEATPITLIVDKHEQTVVCQLPQVTLPHRAAHYLLLQMARARHYDAAFEAETALENGWRHTSEFAREIGITEKGMGVIISRLRNTFRPLLTDPDDVVARRPGTGRIRCGFPVVTIIKDGAIEQPKKKKR